MQENSRFEKNYGLGLHRRNSGYSDLSESAFDLNRYNGPSGTTPDGFIV